MQIVVGVTVPEEGALRLRIARPTVSAAPRPVLARQVLPFALKHVQLTGPDVNAPSRLGAADSSHAIRN